MLLATVILSTSVIAPRSQAQGECLSFARTDFERLYCQLNTQSPGSVPGTLQEFRNNPPATQRLLLRRPAERMGLQLPSTPAPPSAAPPSKPATPAKSSAPKSMTKTKPDLPMREAESETRTGLGHCRLQGATIRCNRQTYKLLPNLNNNHLSSGVLDADNRLALGDAPTKGSAEDWLQGSYVEYLEAMVAIGLAGETLSYTKFHHLYQEADAAGVSFMQRMADMYEYLKKDKRALAVRAGHANGLPASLTECYPLNQRYIVCDNVSVNWIYQQQ